MSIGNKSYEYALDKKRPTGTDLGRYYIWAFAELARQLNDPKEEVDEELITLTRLQEQVKRLSNETERYIYSKYATAQKWLVTNYNIAVGRDEQLEKCCNELFLQALLASSAGPNDILKKQVTESIKLEAFMIPSHTGYENNKVNINSLVYLLQQFYIDLQIYNQVIDAISEGIGIDLEPVKMDLDKPTNKVKEINDIIEAITSYICKNFNNVLNDDILFKPIKLKTVKIDTILISDIVYRSSEYTFFTQSDIYRWIRAVQKIDSEPEGPITKK